MTSFEEGFPPSLIYYTLLKKIFHKIRKKTKLLKKGDKNGNDIQRKNKKGTQNSR